MGASSTRGQLADQETDPKGDAHALQGMAADLLLHLLFRGHRTLLAVLPAILEAAAGIVGGMAAGIVAPFWRDAGPALGKMIAVESYMSSCFLDSIEAQQPQLVDIADETLMAGLSCGEVSDLAWQILQPSLHHCVSITDDAIAPLMAGFAANKFGGGSIEAGECATAGLAALLAAHQNPAVWQALELGPDATVLLIGTEGATDPQIYQSMLTAGK